jgi:hypothetical protein
MACFSFWIELVRWFFGGGVIEFMRGSWLLVGWFG